MSDTENKYNHRLHELLHQRQAAARGERDQWNLPPVRRGWRRGLVTNLRQSEETCEFGILHILDFDLAEQRDAPGIPVRMTATGFTERLSQGVVVDVPDPTPSTRPITPTRITFSYSNGDELVAYYPGRDPPEPPNRLLAVLAVGGPVIFLLGSIGLLHFVLRVF